jgi:hypothetical protein
MIPYTQVDRINALVNHESISRWTLLGEKRLELDELIVSGKALFFGDENGGFLCYEEEQGIWSVHTQFLKGYRGSRVPKIAKEAMSFMFQNTSCLALSTFVEHENRAAKALTLTLGFHKIGEGELEGHSGERFLFTIKDWARALCQQQPS